MSRQRKPQTVPFCGLRVGARFRVRINLTRIELIKFSAAWARRLSGEYVAMLDNEQVEVGQ